MVQSSHTSDGKERTRAELVREKKRQKKLRASLGHGIKEEVLRDLRCSLPVGNAGSTGHVYLWDEDYLEAAINAAVTCLPAFCPPVRRADLREAPEEATTACPSCGRYSHVEAQCPLQLYSISSTAVGRRRGKNKGGASRSSVSAALRREAFRLAGEDPPPVVEGSVPRRRRRHADGSGDADVDADADGDGGDGRRGAGGIRASDRSPQTEVEAEAEEPVPEGSEEEEEEEDEADLIEESAAGHPPCHSIEPPVPLESLADIEARRDRRRAAARESRQLQEIHAAADAERRHRAAVAARRSAASERECRHRAGAPRRVPGGLTPAAEAARAVPAKVAADRLRWSRARQAKQAAQREEQKLQDVRRLEVRKRAAAERKTEKAAKRRRGALAE